MEAVARSIADSNNLPNDMSLLLQEADTSSENADVDLPVLEITPVDMEHVVVNNTDFVGFVTDDHGNYIGRIFRSEYEMTLELAIWTTTEDGYDPDDLGEQLRNALYKHSSYGPSEPLPDPERNGIDDITYFRLADGGRDDDLLQTPTVRRWSQEIELWGCEEFRTDEEYIVSVAYPAPGDFNDSDNDGTVDNT